MVTATENTTKHFDNIIVRINEAGRLLNLPDWKVEILSDFKLEWSGGILLYKDDGSKKTYKACRAACWAPADAARPSSMPAVMRRARSLSDLRTTSSLGKTAPEKMRKCC